MAGLILSLAFHTEDPDGVEDTVNIFLFPDLSLSAISKAALVVRRWDTTLDIRTMVAYSDTASLLQHQEVELIIGWEAAVNILEQWVVFLTVIMVLVSSLHAVYEITMYIDASDEVNVRLWGKSNTNP